MTPRQRRVICGDTMKPPHPKAEANVAYQHVMANGGFAAWNGWCVPLVDALLDLYPCEAFLWIDCKLGPGLWQFHAVVVLCGVVHDAWNPILVLPPTAYVARVFGRVPWKYVYMDGREVAA